MPAGGGRVRVKRGLARATHRRPFHFAPARLQVLAVAAAIGGKPPAPKPPSPPGNKPPGGTPPAGGGEELGRCKNCVYVRRRLARSATCAAGVVAEPWYLSLPSRAAHLFLMSCRARGCRAAGD